MTWRNDIARYLEEIDGALIEPFNAPRPARDVILGNSLLRFAP
jgi:hypothetical protein